MSFNAQKDRPADHRRRVTVLQHIHRVIVFAEYLKHQKIYRLGQSSTAVIRKLRTVLPAFRRSTHGFQRPGFVPLLPAYLTICIRAQGVLRLVHHYCIAL